MFKICAMLTANQGIPNMPCQQAMQASYVQVGAKNGFDMTQHYLEHEMYANIDRPVVYSIAAVGFAYYSVRTNTLVFSAPVDLGRTHIDNISVNTMDQSYSLNWRWSW